MATTSSSTSPPLPSIKTIEHSRVSPPKDSVPDTSIPLTSFDVFWLFYGAVEFLFFFKLPFSTSHFMSHHLPTFKSSLSLALQHFFPLCGHVRRCSSSSHYEIHYTDGDSVSLTLSESTGDFQELSGHQPKDFKKTLHPLIPSLTNESNPLMALQLTVFPDHDGLCLGVSIKHIVTDGTGFINFIKSWATTNLARVPTLSTPPLLDRTIISDNEKLYSVNLEATRLIKTKLKEFSANVDSPDDDVVFATFSLNKEELKKIKDSIIHKYGGVAAVPFYCSTFVAACAYMWTCLIKSRKLPSERTAHFVFAVDARPRMTPAIPPSYFGNYLGYCFTEVKVGDVMDGDGVVHVAAAEAIGKAIDELLKHGVLREAEEWPKKLMALSSDRPLSISGSPKFGVYDIDFGWGKPVKVEVTSMKESGSMSMAESSGMEGGGGLEFGLAFPKHEIDAFQACFTSGLQLL